MLVQCDASQLEWRVLLELAQDQIGIAEILEKEDVHSKNQAAFVLPRRLIAKIFMHVSTDPKFWDSKNESFYTKYEGINRTHQLWSEEVLNGRAIEGPFGRSWTIGIKYDKWGNLKVPWTTLTNYPVQGTGADVMMFARIAAYRRLKKLGLPLEFVSTVHDSIVVDTSKVYVQPVVDTFHQVFDDLPKMFKGAFGYNWTVPMDCECKMGMNMKDMQKVKRSA
jgi:hypothetical protein